MSKKLTIKEGDSPGLSRKTTVAGKSIRRLDTKTLSPSGRKGSLARSNTQSSKGSLVQGLGARPSLKDNLAPTLPVIPQKVGKKKKESSKSPPGNKKASPKASPRGTSKPSPRAESKQIVQNNLKKPTFMP